ncbi:PP2C family protein-serine/threonine phosphatase [Propionibacteriaceae bacterium G57]|uniref:PP2C family protein-serine/threonine phosphatase n=1 Tax=Aestuariimicrobium sp. G57 TaxID=3418485 RepID=UPI003DA76A99
MSQDQEQAPEDATRDLSALNPMRRDYSTSPAPWLAGSTDIGRRHHQNQDAIALWADAPGEQGQPRGVLVVSDGVSSSPNSDRASKTASLTVTDLLGSRLEQDSFHDGQVGEIYTEVFEAANRAVLADGADGSLAGSCTLIAAVVQGTSISVANIGDTRAYWLPDQGQPQQLSTDDSVAQTQIELGVPREQAESSIHAHAITKWLGPEATDLEPRVTSMDAEGDGWLLVCSDGLWNYASEAETMGRLLAQYWNAMPAGDGPDVLSRALVGWANAQGGRDNISVCLARVSAAR